MKTISGLLMCLPIAFLLSFSGVILGMMIYAAFVGKLVP